MKQVVVIHGGTTFSSYEKYIDHLRTKQVRLDRLAPFLSWKDHLQHELGDDYQVLLPSMPNATNANYDEWKIYFDRICEVLTGDIILIGHSLGGIFLAKYLSENRITSHVAATILIAAPFDDETGEDLTKFKLTSVSDLFTQQAGDVIFFHGEDDPVVPLDEMKKYQYALPTATFHIVTAPDHFVRESFDELIDAIRKLA